MKITRLALNRPVTTVMVFVSAVVLGLVSTRLIPLQYFPEFDIPFIFVDLPYSGSSPDETERLIVRPAEEVLATIPGVERMSSTAHSNGGNVRLMFKIGEDTATKGMLVREKLDAIVDQFPSDFTRYYVWQRSISDESILDLRISSERDLSNAYELLNRKVKNSLERIDGVSRVELNGVVPRELRVELNADRVAAHNINVTDLATDLQNANFAVSGGRITDAGRRLIVRPVGSLTTAEQVANLVINKTGVRLRDVADVTYDQPVLDYGRHLDRSYAIAIEVYKEGGANTVAVCESIINEVEKLRQDPEMRGIAIYEMDNQGAGIVYSIRELLKAGVTGAFFAFVVLFFFLRRWSTTTIVALSVPISLIITLGVLYFAGISLNILTMMGLMLAIGMLVDNAVVVTESIHRHQLLSPSDPRGSSIRGVKEVGLAVTAGTFTTGIVFLPNIISQQDQISLFLKHVSITICVALAASLLVSQTIVPMLTARLKPHDSGRKLTIVDRGIGLYKKVLTWTLRHRAITTIASVLILGSGFLAGQLANFDFGDDEGGERRIRLHYHLDGTYQLPIVEQAVDTIEDYLYANQEKFEIESVYTWYTTNQASSTILLIDEKDAELEPDEIEELIQEDLPKLAIARPNFSWRRSDSREENIRVVVQGESSEVLSEIAEQLAERINLMDGFKDALSESEKGSEEIHILVDRQRARQYGFSSQQIAGTVSSAMRGRNIRRFHNEDGEIELRLQYKDGDKQTTSDITNLTIQRTGQSPIRLAALADVKRSTGPRSIEREQRQTVVGVHAKLDGINSGDARRQLQQLMQSYQLPPGYNWGFGTQFNRDQESQNIMLRNVLLALMLIYLVMAGLFESLIHPLAIWISMLYGIVGMMWFFVVTKTIISILAWIGGLILIGVVVNNGIVLVEHINNLRREGQDRTSAVLQAGAERFRPILMTAATTVLGLIPLSLSNTLIGGDGPPYYPMARAIVGGLSFATIVTLLILPTIYIHLDNLRGWGSTIVSNSRSGFGTKVKL